MTAVLVLRRGGLGDTLLMLPVLAALRRELPGAALHFAGVQEFAAVLQEYGAVDRALSSESLQLWALGHDAAAGKAARSALQRYARIVGDDPAVRSVVGPRIDVFDPRPARDDEPLAQQIGRQVGLDVRLDDAVLVGQRAEVDGDVVVLAPGSGAVNKCWPRERWLELAGDLATSGRRLTVVVGPTEIERDDPRRWPWPSGTEFFVDLTCVELAQELARVRVFVGNDSGTTHLAAALRVPTVVVFDTGEPRVFAPRGDRVCVVRRLGSGAAWASCAAVLRALAECGVYLV